MKWPAGVTLSSKSEGHKGGKGRKLTNWIGTTMQKIENRKENLNALLANYRPIGPRHLLAAALRAQAKKDDEQKEEATTERKAKAA